MWSNYEIDSNRRFKMRYETTQDRKNDENEHNFDSLDLVLDRHTSN